MNWIGEWVEKDIAAATLKAMKHISFIRALNSPLQCAFPFIPLN
jgi:hypothetical protein